MKTSTLQNSTELLSDWAWKTFTDFWGTSQRARPPIFYFLSEKSKGSLSSRSPQEIELVHWQQKHGEGITLQFPPMAYVSHLSQVPEETAHLFALVHQISDLQSLGEMTLEDALVFELRFMSLHECFAKFSTNLIMGKSQSIPRTKGKSKLQAQDIWELAHREGYYLAHTLTQRFLSGKVNRSQLMAWFNCDWTQQRGLVAMRGIYRLTQESPISKHFL